jgi:hypothetical protein
MDKGQILLMRHAEKVDDPLNPNLSPVIVAAFFLGLPSHTTTGNSACGSVASPGKSGSWFARTVIVKTSPSTRTSGQVGWSVITRTLASPRGAEFDPSCKRLGPALYRPYG